MLLRAPSYVKIFCCDYFVVSNSNRSSDRGSPHFTLHGTVCALCAFLRLNFVEGVNSSIAISVVLWRVAGAY